MRLLSTLGVLCGLFIGSAQAQSTVDTVQELVPMPAEASIVQDTFVDYAELAFPAGPREGAGRYAALLEGTGPHWQVVYEVDTDVAKLRLYRSYLQYFEENNFEIVFAGDGRAELDPSAAAPQAGGRFLRDTDFLNIGPVRGTPKYILARRSEPNVIISLSFYDDARHNRRIMVNVLKLEDMATVDLFATPTTPEAAPALEERVEPVQQDVAMLESSLLSDGRVVVDAILFAFDSASILPQSTEALETVAGLMNDQPELKLLVVGHTDGVGGFDYNLRLSLERATAVVNWLRERHDIAANRLRPAGAGPMSPITTNRTEEGRALNRRVELVEVID